MKNSTLFQVTAGFAVDFFLPRIYNKPILIQEEEYGNHP